MDNLTEEEIKKENIQYRILVIKWERKVVNKYHNLETVQEKIGVMHHQIKEFIELFIPLFKKGLPFFWEEKEGILSQNEYNDKLINCRLNQIQFHDKQQQSLSVKIMIDKSTRDFEMLFNFKAMCAKLPYFSYS